MPVLAEQTERERKRGRGWLWLAAVLPVLLVLFVVRTTVRPLVVETGGLVVFVGGELGRGANGFHSRDISAPDEIAVGGRRYLATDTTHVRCLQLGYGAYGVGWF